MTNFSDGKPKASMGPRLMSRGKPNLMRTPAAAEVASMGPRLMSRGKALAELNGDPIWTLQWGRGS